MTTATMSLPWPCKRLSPNARVHWSALAAAKKKAKEYAFYSARADLPAISGVSVKVRYTFCPPSKRRYDLDNLVASMKAAADGIAMAIKIDDSKWQIEVAPLGPVAPNGKVLVELEWQH